MTAPASGEPRTALRAFLASVTSNTISLLGSALTTASAVLFLSLWIIQSVGFRGGAYLGIITFLVLPGIFAAGLALIPLGIAREKRRRARTGDTSEARLPVLDLNQGRTRKLALIFLAATLVNVVLLAVATYEGIEVMDSTEFCGKTCHSVMDPEFTAYSRSPHSRVKCVECHIGPGAGWFVKSKLSGSWQLVSVALDLYPRPIPTPVHNLRPARETCEQCHWPTKFVGDKLRVRTHYEETETNDEVKTVLMLRVGGKLGSSSHGIHWHVDPGVEIKYRSDPSRETIYEVQLRDHDGNVRLYRGASADTDAGKAAVEWRTMDCVDCHNRPTHIYRMPVPELDLAIQDGRIDRRLPWIRREGLKALQGAYASHEEAREAIRTAVRGFYQQNYVDRVPEWGASIDAAANALGDIWCSNIFPNMKITWGTYPNHIGHEDSPGCFRCHSGELSSPDGRTIEQDCSTCHALLAMGEKDPEILKQLEP
jgi:hypothetical protein